MKTCLALLALSIGFVAGAEPPAKDKENKIDEAALLKALRDADAVFAAQVGATKPVAQTNSIPPSILGEVSFTDVKVLRGKTEAKKFSYSYREGSTKNLDLGAKGEVIVAVKGTSVLAIVPSTEATLALVKKAGEKDEKK